MVNFWSIYFPYLVRSFNEHHFRYLSQLHSALYPSYHLDLDGKLITTNIQWKYMVFPNIMDNNIIMEKIVILIKYSPLWLLSKWQILVQSVREISYNDIYVSVNFIDIQITAWPRSIRSNLILGMVCCLFGTKPLHKAMMTECQPCWLGVNNWMCFVKISYSTSCKYIWKCCLHFVPATMITWSKEVQCIILFIGILAMWFAG